MSHVIAVFGVYKTRSETENAVEALKTAGFRHSDISVLLPTSKNTLDFANENSTQAPEGAVAGAETGAVLGGTLGWLAGIGALGIPGLGPFIAAGPILAALAGVGVGGALGGLSGAMVAMGLAEFDAEKYERLVKEGGILCLVHCDDIIWEKKAKEILNDTQAHHISSMGEPKNKSTSIPSSHRPSHERFY